MRIFTCPGCGGPTIRESPDGRYLFTRRMRPAEREEMKTQLIKVLTGVDDGLGEVVRDRSHYELIADILLHVMEGDLDEVLMAAYVREAMRVAARGG